MAANKVPAIRHILLVVFTLLAIATATSHISNTAHFDTGLLTGLIGLIATANLIAYALTRTHIFISNSLFGLLLGLTLNHYLAISLTDYQSPFFWSGEHHLSLLVHLTMGLALLSCELWLRETLSSPRSSVAIRLAAAVLAISLLASIALAEQRMNFVSSVSHELKTPLTTILMYSDILLTGRKRNVRILSAVSSILTFASLYSSSKCLCNSKK